MIKFSTKSGVMQSETSLEYTTVLVADVPSYTGFGTRVIVGVVTDGVIAAAAMAALTSMTGIEEIVVNIVNKIHTISMIRGRIN